MRSNVLYYCMIIVIRIVLSVDRIPFNFVRLLRCEFLSTSPDVERVFDYGRTRVCRISAHHILCCWFSLAVDGHFFFPSQVSDRWRRWLLWQLEKPLRWRTAGERVPAGGISLGGKKFAWDFLFGEKCELLKDSKKRLWSLC